MTALYMLNNILNLINWWRKNIFWRWIFSSSENDGRTATKRTMICFWSLSVKANSMQENFKLIDTGMQGW